MATQIELSSLDLRYEAFRLKQAPLEQRLLSSIAQRGIEEPLEGVEVQECHVLLNGFKRYRCARKLQIHTVPYTSLGPDEVVAILNLLRISNNRSLGILEQAAFLDELKNTRNLSIAEIAQELSPEQIVGEHAFGAGIFCAGFSPGEIPVEVHNAVRGHFKIELLIVVN